MWVFLLAVSYGNLQVTTQEFSSKEKCEKARVEFVEPLDGFRDKVKVAKCVPK